MSRDNAHPIIVKKIKKGGDGHHGGAWKVAYADFVTAMMAFFMLMWLLNATTEKQRKGLADYFSPTVAISRASGGGDGAAGGSSMTADASMVQIGRGGITPSQVHGTTAESAELAAAEAAILGKGGDTLLTEEQLRHVTLRLTDEGLVLELFALPGRPLFEGAVPTPLLTGLLDAMGAAIAERAQAIAIDVHVAGEPIVTRQPLGWARAADRAEAVRRILPDHGIAESRVARLTGHSDRRPAVRNPLAERNNRVELTLLRGAP